MKQKWAGMERRKSLRRNAEALVADIAPEEAAAKPTELLMHELLVHKVQLELQGEELRQANIAAMAFESRQGMMVTDANGMILRINQELSTTTGYAAEEVVGRSSRLFQSGRHDANFFAEMWASISRSGSWEGEIWNKRKNGEVHSEHLTISAVKDADGIVNNYVAIYMRHPAIPA